MTASNVIAAHGVSIRVPPGWEAELSLQQDPATMDTNLKSSLHPKIVLHAANFALPPNLDDYGLKAVEALGSGIFIALIEFARESASSRLFSATGVPTLHAEEFAGDQLIRPIKHQLGSQRFFREGPRTFCLYTVIGSARLKRVLVREANRVLSGLKIS